MCVSATISNYLGLVTYGKHRIEMQYQGRRIALLQKNKSVKRNWRKAVVFAVGWHQTLFYSAIEAQTWATRRDLVVYTWQCFGTLRENWLRRGVTNVDTCTARKCRCVYCYTVLPSDAPESVRLAEDDTGNVWLDTNWECAWAEYPWEETAMEYLKKEWHKAQRIFEQINPLLEQMDMHPRHWLKRLVMLWNSAINPRPRILSL